MAKLHVAAYVEVGYSTRPLEISITKGSICDPEKDPEAAARELAQLLTYAAGELAEQAKRLERFTLREAEVLS